MRKKKEGTARTSFLDYLGSVIDFNAHPLVLVRRTIRAD